MIKRHIYSVLIMEIFVLLCCASKFCDAQSNTWLSNNGSSLSVQTFVEDVFVSKYSAEWVIFKSKIKNRLNDTIFIKDSKLQSTIVDSNSLENMNRNFLSEHLVFLSKKPLNKDLYSGSLPHYYILGTNEEDYYKYRDSINALNTNAAYKMFPGDSTNYYEPIKYYYIAPEDSIEIYTIVSLHYFNLLTLDSIYRKDNVEDIAEVALIYNYKTQRSSEDKLLSVNLSQSMIDTFFIKLSGKSSK